MLPNDRERCAFAMSLWLILAVAFANWPLEKPARSATGQVIGSAATFTVTVRTREFELEARKPSLDGKLHSFAPCGEPSHRIVPVVRPWRDELHVAARRLAPCSSVRERGPPVRFAV
jgi:hypothetical protein